ncbi:unnamed protein product [Ixodes pacificus]
MPSKRREKAEFNVRKWKGERIFSGICLFCGGTFFCCTIYAKLQSCFVASTPFTPRSTSTRNDESMSETASTPHFKSCCAFPASAVSGTATASARLPHFTQNVQF